MRRLVVAGLVVGGDGRILCARRTGPAELAGFWEFPGGKVEPGEEPRDALVRELREELSLDVTVGDELVAPDGAWPISDALEMRVWWCRVVDGVPGPGVAHDTVVWHHAAGLAQLRWAPADVAVAAAAASVAPAPDTRERVLAVVANPTAAGYPAVRGALEVQAAQQGFDDVLWLPTTPEDFGLAQSREALARGASQVVAGGGDGTVRAVAQALRGTGVPLGVVPLGTANIFARNLGLDVRHPTSCVAPAVGGVPHAVDLGVCRWRTEPAPDSWSDEHLFLVLAGIGHDAATVAGTRPAVKTRAGWLAYFVSGARMLGRAALDMEVSYDDGPPEHRALWSLLVGNAGTVPPGITVFPGAGLDDGSLRALAVHVTRPWQWLPVALGGLVRADLPRRLEHRRVSRVDVTPDRPLLLQLDGDVFGPVVVAQAWVDPESLQVLTTRKELP